ncbi:MAG: hypothetical protein ACLFNK_04600, partial [Candidatus Woesearchaeota archaeon]
DRLSDEADVKIVNFGLGGADFFTIKERINNTINFYDTPDLVIIYSGHNDYTNYYQRSRLNDFFKRFFLITSPPSRIFDSPVQGRGIRGPFLNLLQGTGLLSFNGSFADDINEVILEQFKDNNVEIQKLLAEKDVPLLYMTTIGNLEARPFGDIKITEKFYQQGMNTDDHTERITQLKKAMDSEIFTYDIRAPSEHNEYLRSIDARGIHILDIESELIEDDFNFSHDDFSDYLHFKGSTHRRIAKSLDDYIVEVFLDEP